jgi:hypothetical protein
LGAGGFPCLKFQTWATRTGLKIKTRAKRLSILRCADQHPRRSND